MRIFDVFAIEAKLLEAEGGFSKIYFGSPWRCLIPRFFARLSLLGRGVAGGDHYWRVAGVPAMRGRNGLSEGIALPGWSVRLADIQRASEESMLLVLV